MKNKKFWETIPSFLTSNRIISVNEISHFEGQKVVNDESKVVKILNVSYINVVEKFSWIKPTSDLEQRNKGLSTAIDIAVKRYSSYPSIKKNNFKHFNPFSLQKASNKNIQKLIKTHKRQ